MTIHCSTSVMPAVGERIVSSCHLELTWWACSEWAKMCTFEIRLPWRSINRPFLSVPDGKQVVLWKPAQCAACSLEKDSEKIATANLLWWLWQELLLWVLAQCTCFAEQVYMVYIYTVEYGYICGLVISHGRVLNAHVVIELRLFTAHVFSDIHG